MMEKTGVNPFGEKYLPLSIMDAVSGSSITDKTFNVLTCIAIASAFAITKSPFDHGEIRAA